jgi:hypothetical protein
LKIGVKMRWDADGKAENTKTGGGEEREEFNVLL